MRRKPWNAARALLAALLVSAGLLVGAPGASAGHSTCSNFYLLLDKYDHSPYVYASTGSYCKYYFYAKVSVYLYKNGNLVASRTASDASQWGSSSSWLSAQATEYNSAGTQRWQGRAVLYWIDGHNYKHSRELWSTSRYY